MITSSDNQTKQCPFCGEAILSIAIKCKYCHSMLDDYSLGLSAAEGSLENLISQRPKSVLYVSFLIYLKVFLAVIGLASSQKVVWNYLYLINADNAESINKNIFVVGILVFVGLLLMVLIAYKINQGKDWARVAFMVFTSAAYILLIFIFLMLGYYGMLGFYVAAIFTSFNAYDYLELVFNVVSDILIFDALMSRRVRYWFTSIKHVERGILNNEMIPNG